MWTHICIIDLGLEQYKVNRIYDENFSRVIKLRSSTIIEAPIMIRNLFDRHSEDVTYVREQQIKEANANDTTKRSCWLTRWFKAIGLIVFVMVLKAFSLFKPLFKTIMFLYDLGSKHIRVTLSTMSISFVMNLNKT